MHPALDRLRAVAGLGDDAQVRLALQHEPQAAPDDGVVVGEHDPGVEVSGHVGGSSRVTRAPPSGLGPSRSVAPISTARSRIPRTPPPSVAPRGQPGPSSSTSSVGRPPTSSSRTSARLAPGVAGDVGQRLLGDAVEHELGVAAEVRQAGLDVHVDLELGVLGDALAEHAQRARQAEVVERLRPQHARDPAHLLEAAAGRLLRLQHALARRLGHVARDAAELQHDAGQRLPDAVVELLRDAQPLALLRGQRAARRCRGARPPAARASR